MNFKLKIFKILNRSYVFIEKFRTFPLEQSPETFAQSEIIIFAINGNIRLLLIVVQTCKEQILR